MKVNVNQKCSVILRKRGVEAYYDYYKRLGLSPPKNYQIGDTFSGQLWEVMHLFGSKSYMGPEPPFDTEIEIDYIRILSPGFNPKIDFFKPLRTILKPGVNIPLRAGILNEGDQEGSLTTTLILPDEIHLIEGIDQNVISDLRPDETDSLAWTIVFSDTGSFLLSLLAAACWSGSNIVIRYAVNRAASRGEKLDMLSLVVWSSLVPPIPLMILALMFDTPETLLHAISNLNGISIFAVFYLAFFATILR